MNKRSRSRLLRYTTSTAIHHLTCLLNIDVLDTVYLYSVNDRVIHRTKIVAIQHSALRRWPCQFERVWRGTFTVLKGLVERVELRAGSRAIQSTKDMQ